MSAAYRYNILWKWQDWYRNYIKMMRMQTLFTKLEIIILKDW